MASKNTPPSYPKAQARRAQRMQEFLAAYSRPDVRTMKEATQRVRLSDTTFRQWRRESKEFDNKVEAIKLEKRAMNAARKNEEAADLVVPIDRDYPPVPGFAQFRREYLGRPVAPHQHHMVNAWEDLSNRVVIVLQPPGPQPLGTPVLTPGGWRKIEDIRIGEHVIGRDGQYKVVQDARRVGIQPTYRVEFNDGTHTYAAASHRWEVKGRTRRGRGWHPATTEELAQKVETAQGRWNWQIPLTPPVAFPTKEQPLDPYVFGVLLGDGSFRQNSVKITSNDPELIEHVATRLPDSLQIRQFADIQYRITDIDMALGTTKGTMRTMLDELDLWWAYSYEKHIPDAYLYGDAAQRMAVLQGLMDTDGNIDTGGRIAFTSTSPALIAGVQELVRSLGGWAGSPHVDSRGKRPCYTISISMNECPFLLSRKRARFGERRRDVTRKIIAVEPVAPTENMCLTVDGGFYQANDYIVLRNSGKDTTAGDFVLHELAQDRNRRVAWMMESENFSKRRIKQRLSPYLFNRAVYRSAPDGPDTSVPSKNLIDDYGPFKWQKGMRWDDGSEVERTNWNSNEIYFIQHGAPEADPNLWATGVGGAVYGSRIDTLYLSDPFTVENQRGSEPPKQREFIMGTLRTRLDEKGRLMVLGTRVRSGDNYEWMLNYFVGESRIVKQSDDGQYTKYANGVAVIVIPAIQYDAEGEEVSYWPERFPLENHLRLADGTMIPQSSVSEDEWDHHAEQIGTEFIGGLAEIRANNPDMFETIYQQNPPANRGGEFTDIILDHCDDPSRSFGVYRPNEILVLAVDPARTAGAAHIVWGYDPDTGVATVVDEFYGEKLGVLGIKNKLIMEPARQYLPRAMVYEVNQQSAVLEMSEIKDGLKALAVDVVPHTTHQYNRNEGDFRVAAMVFDMRDGLIRWPAATREDRERSQRIKKHFKNWDAREAAKENRESVRNYGPDDEAMAAWIGWVYIKRELRRNSRNLRATVSRIPEWVRRRGGTRKRSHSGLESAKTGPSTDLLADYLGVTEYEGEGRSRSGGRP